MKKLINYTATFLIGFFVFSCSNDFLTEGPEVSSAGDSSIMISPDGEYNDYVIYCPAARNDEFTITHAPDWLNISSRSGKFVDGVATIQCSANVNPDFSEIGIYYAQMIVSVKNKNYAIQVSYITAGDPVIETDENLSNGYQEPLYLSVQNSGKGLLFWELVEYPEWLSLDWYSLGYTQGMLLQGEMTQLYFTFNGNFIPDDLSGRIVIKSNDKNNPEKIINIRFDIGNVQAIEGVVTDAWLDRKTDILYLTTTMQPNSLLAFNVETKTISRKLDLNSAPTCFSVSEDGHKAVIGHDGQISYINLDDFSLIKTIEVNYRVNDIAWGTNDWFCYTDDYGWEPICWVNVNTGATHRSQESFYRTPIINKIPHQNYILVSMSDNWNNGMYLFNTETREQTNYFYAELGKYWFSEDGNFVFSNAAIYETSLFFIQDAYISSIGRFYPSPYQTCWIDHHAATHNVWALSATDYYAPREIWQYKDDNFNRVKTYNCHNYYIKNGEILMTQPQYVFANKAGTELTVIRSSNYVNIWSLEFIPITE